MCVCVHSCSTINTTALASCPLTTHSTSSSATYWASRKRKSRKRRNVRVSLQNKRGWQKLFFSHLNTHPSSVAIAKLKKMKKKKKRGEEFSMEGRPHVTKIFAKFSHDAPLPMIKKKHLTIEQLNARRRKVWLTIAKKEIPKVQPFFFGISLGFVTQYLFLLFPL